MKVYLLVSDPDSRSTIARVGDGSVIWGVYSTLDNARNVFAEPPTDMVTHIKECEVDEATATGLTFPTIVETLG